MLRLTKGRKRFINALLIAICIGFVVCLISHLGLLHKLHLKSTDFLYGTSESDTSVGDSPIVIVAIDDNSLEQLGRFSSWPRSYHTPQIINLIRSVPLERGCGWF